MAKILSNYLFRITEEDEREGEMFFVQAADRTEAFILAELVFPDTGLTYEGRYTDFEAEWLGYDTY